MQGPAWTCFPRALFKPLSPENQLQTLDLRVGLGGREGGQGWVLCAESHWIMKSPTFVIMGFSICQTYGWAEVSLKIPEWVKPHSNTF